MIMKIWIMSVKIKYLEMFRLFLLSVSTHSKKKFKYMCVYLCVCVFVCVCVCVCAYLCLCVFVCVY